MAENTKYVARVPIVPDDFNNQDEHKNHELVMDFNTADLYIKDGDGYVNITGKLREEIKKIHDGSAVIHIVTEDTLPAVEERSQNHWYYVITKAENSSGDSIATANYIYYGTVKSYYPAKDYLLISQNTTIGSSRVKFHIEEGYSPCLYIPTNMSATFSYAPSYKFLINSKLAARANQKETTIEFDTSVGREEYNGYKYQINLMDENMAPVAPSKIGNIGTSDSFEIDCPTETKNILFALYDNQDRLIGSQFEKVVDPNPADVGENIDFEIKDRVYAINTLTGTYIAYDVYILEIYDPGYYTVDMEISGSDHLNVSFDTNESSIEGLVLPNPISVRDGDCIGTIPDPTWEDPRFEFIGWSSSKIAYTEVDPESYKPEYNIILYAWFEYNDDPSLSGYSVDQISDGN